MRGPARIAAAANILDDILAGKAAEQALTNWARSNRYAGSGDRAAIRDIVFECLRRRSSFAHLGGALTGRGLSIGYARFNDLDLTSVFSSEKFSPDKITQDEEDRFGELGGKSDEVKFDCPAWLVEPLRHALGEEFANSMQVLQSRAPMDLRVNLARCDRDAAANLLLEDDIETESLPLVETGLRVTKPTRKLPQSKAYQAGLVELQDAGAQYLMAKLQGDFGTALDYCAGGGGKSLALAALSLNTKISAYDISQKRLAQITERAARAGAEIELLSSEPTSMDRKYDLVVLDVPCSGSGSWRRTPDAKWRLTQGRLSELNAIQTSLLEDAKHVAQDGGQIAYITCSLLTSENEDQISAFLENQPDWTLADNERLNPCDAHDGFYFALLRHSA